MRSSGQLFNCMNVSSIATTIPSLIAPPQLVSLRIVRRIPSPIAEIISAKYGRMATWLYKIFVDRSFS